MSKFEEYDMVIVEYKGTRYPMCVTNVDKRNKQLHVKSLRFDNFDLIVSFNEVEKITDIGF